MKGCWEGRWAGGGGGGGGGGQWEMCWQQKGATLAPAVPPSEFCSAIDLPSLIRRLHPPKTPLLLPSNPMVLTSDPPAPILSTPRPPLLNHLTIRRGGPPLLMHCRPHHWALQELRFDPRAGGRRRTGEPDSGHNPPRVKF